MKLIVNFGNGVDNIDVIIVNNCGINVINIFGVLIEDIVDMIMVLMLVVLCWLFVGIYVFESGDWVGWLLIWMFGYWIWGKCFGIIGMGWIG